MARSWSKVAVAFAISAAVVAGLGACSSNEQDDVPTGPPLTVGSMESTESQILAELYSQALENAGTKVVRSFSLGDREATIAALQDGSVDVVPELNGELLSLYAPDSGSRDRSAVNAELRKLLPEGTQILDVSPAESKTAYVITRATADEFGITSIADLATLGAASLGATSQFAELGYGIPGLKASYGLAEVTLAPIDDDGGAETVSALVDGTVQFAAIAATSPAIAENDLVVLTDPKSLIRAQNVVPMLRSSVYTIRLANTLNEVSNRLRSEDISAMRAQVEGPEKADISSVAKAWLKAEGITG